MHDDAYIGGRSESNINASCMTISGGRTKQLDIFCCVTGFTSDFLSFIDVELILFFHGAIQLLLSDFRFLLLWHCWLGDRKGIRPVKPCASNSKVVYGRTLSVASMLYFADVFLSFFYARLSWPNG